MDNALLLMALFLALVVMAAYFYVQRAKRRDATDVAEHDHPTGS